MIACMLRSCMHDWNLGRQVPYSIYCTFALPFEIHSFFSCHNTAALHTSVTSRQINRHSSFVNRTPRPREGAMAHASRGREGGVREARLGQKR